MRAIVLCTVKGGLEAIARAISNGTKIERIIGLNPQTADIPNVSGFVDIAEFAKKRDIAFSYVESYNLKSKNDYALFSSLKYDLIWVAGWQRLVPDWLIKSCKYGILGAHGSPDGITAGRGRSPQNWAILLGCRSFTISVFKIQNGIDDGDIVCSKTFEINETDDIDISYKKTALCVADIISEILSNVDLLSQTIKQNEEPYYFPKRIPADGYIDWSRNTTSIVRFCQALSHPYPGMWTISNGNTIKIWKCSIFDSKTSTPGRIEHVFEDRSFLVGCANGHIIATDYESSNKWEPKVNMQLSYPNFSEQIKNICDRHINDFPDAPISRRITKLL